MDTHTFDQALTSARQLPPRERARLIAQLVEELAVSPDDVPEPQSANGAEAWERLNQFRAEIAALYPHADIGGRLEADRRERDAMLMGRGATDDVHA